LASSADEAVRGAALVAFDARRSVFAGAVETAIAEGDVLDDVDPDEMADTVRAAVVGAHALLGSNNEQVFTYLSETWRIVLRGIVPAQSLPYFRSFVTRVGQRSTLRRDNRPAIRRTSS
jgi:hypothetical protein